MKVVARSSASNGLALLIFAAFSAALLSGTFGLTRARIEESERQAQERLIAQTLPAGGFDNDLVADARPLAADPLLGLRLPGRAYVARQGGEIRAVVLEAIAPDGYSGEIKLLVGIAADGRVTGVRVTAHRETPGLGDYIEIAKDRWIRVFEGRALDDPSPRDWKVRKDGGHFDYRAGATITPRAVVKAVRRTLEYFDAHRAELLAPAAQSTRG